MKIAISGRGCVGKTSFTALCVKYFLDEGRRPIFLVDADPDQNLAEMLGVELEKQDIKTVSTIYII
jgi:CO dehydrogenase maturation factor